MADAHDLDRFLNAQEGSYETALDELQSGHKRSHWIWFIFPQIAGLGRSPTAQHYAIRSLDEAQAYLAHPILGARLHECIKALQLLPPTSDVSCHSPARRCPPEGGKRRSDGVRPTAACTSEQRPL